MIAINKAHFPVTVLGYGKRIGIWLQGCSIRCRGCVSRDTWERDAGKEITVGQLVEWCRRFENQEIDGITISGGEPFEQPEALGILLSELRAWTDTMSRPIDYLCYSGLPNKILRKQYACILDELDCVVSEPYIENQPTAELRGSSNQKVIPLSELGSQRYEGNHDGRASKRFQVAVESGHIWFIGIPDRGDMTRLEHLCQERGLILGQSSWRS